MNDNVKNVTREPKDALNRVPTANRIAEKQDYQD